MSSSHIRSRSMRTPVSVTEEGLDETFSSAHERVRRKARTGTVETPDDTVAGAVFLDGVALYARYGNESGVEALEALSSRPDVGVRLEPSKPENVRMFRTYLRYIGDDGLLRAEPLDSTPVETQTVEGVRVGGVRNVGAGSWRGETNSEDKTFFPSGVRTVAVPDLVALKRYVTSGDVSGYAAGDGRVVTFRNGEIVDAASVDVGSPVRTDVGLGGGWAVVDADAETTDDADEGIISRIFSD